MVCDEISDPHNLCYPPHRRVRQVHGVIIPKRRSAGLTAISGQDIGGGGELYARGKGF